MTVIGLIIRNDRILRDQFARNLSNVCHLNKPVSWNAALTELTRMPIQHTG